MNSKTLQGEYERACSRCGKPIQMAHVWATGPVMFEESMEPALHVGDGILHLQCVRVSEALAATFGNEEARRTWIQSFKEAGN